MGRAWIPFLTAHPLLPLFVFVVNHPSLTLSAFAIPHAYRITDLITFMSFKFFVQLIEGYPVPFAINYTTGNVLALGASCFLCGPRRQFKNMFDERRRYTSILYLSCLGGTLAVVFVPLQWAIKLATLLCLLLTQCGASFWYSLSYIPYGRKTFLNLAKRTLGLNESSTFQGIAGGG